MLVHKWGEEKSVDKTIYAIGHEKLQEQYLHLNKSNKETIKDMSLSYPLGAPTTYKTELQTGKFCY